MSAGDVWRLSAIGDWGGQYLAVTTMHIKFLSPGATFPGAAAYIKTNLLDLIKGYQSDSFYWRQINGLTVNKVPVQSDIYSTGFPLQGTQAATHTYAFQVAIVASVRTQYAGRSYRGRMYLPGWVEGTTDTGVGPTTTVKNAVQGYYDDLVAALGLAGSNTDYQWVVWSTKLATSNAVNGVIVRATFGTQRRRVAGVGA